MKYCLGFALLLLVPTAFAVPKPWNVEGKNWYGLGLSVAISGFPANNTKVSGTNVNLTVDVMAGPINMWDNEPLNNPPAGTRSYNRIRIIYADFKIGGTTVWSAQESLEPQPYDFRVQPVRYASTHFSDGQSIGLTLYALVELSYAPDSQTGTIPAPCTIDTTLTIANVAYNKGLFLSTLIEPDGSQQSPPPSIQSLQAVSKKVCDFSRTRLASMNHGNDGNNIRTLSSLTGALGQSTVFVASTHGSDDAEGFFSSYSNDPESGEFLSWGTVATATTRAMGIPGHNLALLYSCETVDDPPSGPFAFAIAGDDKAYGGFGVKVGQLVYNSSTGLPTLSLANHADMLLSELANGETIQDALANTEKTWVPLTAGFVETGMIILGDGFTTLNCVYVSDEEIGFYGSGKGKWFLLL